MKWGVRVGEVPRALWVQVALSLAVALVYFVIGIFQDRPLILVGLPLTVVFSWLLLRRSRVVWTLLVAGWVLSVISAPFDHTPWWSVVIGIVTFVLLLHPAVFRFIWRGRRREIPPTTRIEGSETSEERVDAGRQTSWDPRRHPDSDRPKGWYVHPDDPGQMQYWGGEAAGWQGATKTPRRIKAELNRQANRG